MTYNQQNIFFAIEYVLAALVIGISTWRSLQLDVRKRIGRRTFLLRLIPVIVAVIFGVTAIAAIYLLHVDGATKNTAVTAALLVMTVFCYSVLGASAVQRFRVYPRGAMLASVMILMYITADLFMPAGVKFAVLAAMIAIGVFLPDEWK